jgi:Fe-S-cluster containining protein
MPGEAEKAAAYLGMAFEDFKNKYLVVDYWVGKRGHHIEVLAPLKIIPDHKLLPDVDDPVVRAFLEELPKRARAEPGGRAPSSYPFYKGRCVFLDENNRCKIHAVKPYECRETTCDGTGSGTNWRRKVAAAWAKFWKREARCGA